MSGLPKLGCSRDLTSHKVHSCSKREIAEAKGVSEQKETKTFQSLSQTQEINLTDKQLSEKHFVREEERAGTRKIFNKTSILC